MAENAPVRVHASTPEVNISERNEPRIALQMPELEFQFDIDATCAKGETLRTIVVSVADTRARVGISTAVGDAGRVDASTSQITLKVPARQIAPIVVYEFCRVDADTAPADDFLKVHSVLSAQTAVTCANEGIEKTVYTSAGLDVMLKCQRETAATN